MGKKFGKEYKGSVSRRDKYVITDDHNDYVSTERGHTVNFKDNTDRKAALQSKEIPRTKKSKVSGVE